MDSFRSCAAEGLTMAMPVTADDHKALVKLMLQNKVARLWIGVQRVWHHLPTLILAYLRSSAVLVIVILVLPHLIAVSHKDDWSVVIQHGRDCFIFDSFSDFSVCIRYDNDGSDLSQPFLVSPEI